MKICSQCILPETFPGIKFNADGVCNHCQKLDGKRTRIDEEKKRYKQKFLDLLSALGIDISRFSHDFDRSPLDPNRFPLSADRPPLGANRSPLNADRYPYDVLMAYSGGKDSTYTMALLKNAYELRILALSFDNGFVSARARQNIQAVTDGLGVDHLFFKPPWNMLKRIFVAAAGRELFAPKSLERASTICTSCMGIVKAVCLKMAIDMGIPMIAYGWSPGQAPVQSSIMKNNPALLRMSQQALMTPLAEVVGDQVLRYFLQEQHFEHADRMPYNIHPMAWEFYNEDMILDEIRKLGWVSPADTDTNSTNCLLNAYANEVHMKRYGFHPYAWEIANMVREGVMSREDGLSKIYTGQPETLVDYARKRLS